MCCCSPMQRNVSSVPIEHRHTAKFHMCCCSTMQRNVSTAPMHHRHTAKFTCVAARRCKKRLDCTDIHHRHTAKFACVAAHRCREMPGLYRFTIGAPRNLHVLLLADAKRNVSMVQTHHRHTGAATTFQNPFPLGIPAKTANGNDFYRRE